MKLIKSIILILVSVFLVLSVYADEWNPLIFQYHNPEVTVEFLEQPQMSMERQQSIADELAGRTPCTITGPSTTDPENIICTLFGHNIEGPVTVTVTHHRAKQYAPRCLKDVYHVTYCTRCDYAEEELCGSFYVFCCPED